MAPAPRARDEACGGVAVAKGWGTRAAENAALFRSFDEICSRRGAPATPPPIGARTPDLGIYASPPSHEAFKTIGHRRKLFVSGQQTPAAWRACQNWLDDIIGVPQASEIRASTPPFNLPELVSGRASFPRDSQNFNVPCYGGILDEVMKIFDNEHVRACANDLGIRIPEYKIDTFLQGKMSLVREMAEAAAARVDCHVQNRHAAQRMKAFADAFESLQDADFQSVSDWKQFVEQHVALGWEQRLSFDDVLANFGFDSVFASALRQQLVEVHDAKAGVTQSIPWEYQGVRWVAKALCGYKPVGCLTDVVNLVFVMLGHSPAEINAGLSETRIRDVIRQFACDEGSLEKLWVPTHLVCDCESDDMLVWCIVESIHRRAGSHLSVLAQLPEEADADRIEAILSRRFRCTVFRDADSRNIKAVNQYWSSIPSVSTPDVSPRQADVGANDAQVVVHGSLARPPPLPRPRSRRGQAPEEATASTAEFSGMRNWEARWAEIVAEVETAESESGEELIKPQSLPASQHAELLSELAQSSADAETWSERLWSGLGRLRKRVASLSHNAERASAEKLRPLARDIERELAVFKAQQRQQFDALSSEEFGLEEALPVLGRRYEAWLAEPSALFPPQDPSRGGSSSSRAEGTIATLGPAPATEDPEIAELRTALESLEAEAESAGGATGGWSEAHHEAFMRTFRAFKMQATPAFFARLEERLPHLPKSHLADHARWLVENEQLQATKRRLLARRKERLRELQQEAADAEAAFFVKEAEQQRQASEREQRHRAETKKRLVEWRSQRADEEEIIAERRRREEDEQARFEREQRRQQLQQREAVDAYRRRREADRQRARDEEDQATLAASAARRARSQDDRRRIQKRNAEALRRKLQTPSSNPPAGSVAARSLSRDPESTAPRAGRAASERSESRIFDGTTSSMARGTVLAPQDPDVLATTEPHWRGQLRAHSHQSSGAAPPRRAASAGPGLPRRTREMQLGPGSGEYG